MGLGPDARNARYIVNKFHNTLNNTHAFMHVQLLLFGKTCLSVNGNCVVSK